MGALELLWMNPGTRRLDAYELHCGADVVAILREQAKPLAGMRVVHLTAAPLQPAAASLAATSVALLRDLGLDARWALAQGDETADAAGRALRDGLRGGEWGLEADAWSSHRDGWSKALEALAGEPGVVVCHEPEALPAVRAKRSGGPAWVWRTALDLSQPDQRALDAAQPLLRAFDARVVAHESFAPPGAQASISPPGIDPLAPRNIELPHAPSGDLARAAGLDLGRPFIAHIADLDGWSDPEAVIELWRAVREDLPELQLALVGRVPPERHRAWRVRAELDDRLSGERAALALTGLGEVETGAIERLARVVVHSGIRPAWPSDVASALFKRTAAVGDERLAGAPATPDEVAALITDPGLAARRGREGRARVIAEHLVTRALADELLLLARLTS